MRPVIEKQGFKPWHVIYIVLMILCIVAIAIAVYMQFFKDAKIGVILGITEEEDEEYSSLKENFINIFSNDISIEEDYTGDIKKIRESEDLVFLAYDTQEQTDNYTINIKLPYFNIDSDITREFNKEIKSTFKDKSENIISSSSKENKIYNVKYKAYLHKDILSLIILSELKEGSNNQRIIIQTYNYNLLNNKEVEISELLELKNIDQKQANIKIKEEVEKSQEQNTKMAELGYNVNVRDTSKEEYKIQNTEQFFIGQNGYLYIVYPYGNTEYTSEMDVIIFR